MAYFDTGARIRDIRKDAGMSQDQLAELASLNRVTIAKYESGKVEPGAHALSRIADALDVTVDDLLGRTDPKESPDDMDEFREQLRRNPETRMLYDAIRKASPEHIRAATAMLKALGQRDDE